MKTYVVASQQHNQKRRALASQQHLFFFCSITDEDMLLLHNRIPPKDLDLQFSNSRALRAPKVFFFFLAPILLFNYMGSLRDVHQLSYTNEVSVRLSAVLYKKGQKHFDGVSQICLSIF